jgi:hypothetical protein
MISIFWHQKTRVDKCLMAETQILGMNLQGDTVGWKHYTFDDFSTTIKDFLMRFFWVVVHELSNKSA